jgi:hypothetical protein
MKNSNGSWSQTTDTAFYCTDASTFNKITIPHMLIKCCVQSYVKRKATTVYVVTRAEQTVTVVHQHLLTQLNNEESKVAHPGVLRRNPFGHEYVSEPMQMRF